MNITLRQALDTDIQILKDINYSSFEENAGYDPHIDMNWVNTEDAVLYFTDAITKPDHCVYIALVEDVPAGFIILEPKVLTYRTVKTLEISVVAVLPQYRSNGIGTMLIAKAKTWAIEHGYNTLFVNSYIRNKKAIRFYEKHGFCAIDISFEMNL